MKRNEAPMAWEMIFQAIGHPAILLDPEHDVIAANSASIRLTGKSHKDSCPGADTGLFKTLQSLCERQSSFLRNHVERARR